MPVYPHYHFSFPVYSFNSVLRVVSALKPNLERLQQFKKSIFLIPWKHDFASLLLPAGWPILFTRSFNFLFVVRYFAISNFTANARSSELNAHQICFLMFSKIETKGRLVLHDRELVVALSHLFVSEMRFHANDENSNADPVDRAKACTSRQNISQSLMKRCSFWSIKSDFLLPLQLFYDSLFRQLETLRFF